MRAPWSSRAAGRRGVGRVDAGLLVVGLLIAGVGGVLLAAPGQGYVAEVGSLAAPVPSALPAPAGGPAAAARAGTSPADTPSKPGAVTRGGQRSPRAGKPGVDRPVAFSPVRLRLPALDLDAPLRATSTDASGAFVPPVDPAELGWWRGVQPGAGSGSVLVAGHVDAKRYGRGPLAALGELEVGDRAVLVGPGGTSVTYVLRGVRTMVKAELPAAELFGRTGPERLVLVTCGGRFEKARGGWDSNVVAVLDVVSSTA